MRLANALVTLTGPPRCTGCGGSGSPICTRCAGRLARPLADAAPASVSRVVAAFEYDGPARRAVLDLKLSGRRAAAAPLVDGMARAAQRHGLRGRVITWVPCRRRDAARRGYDHAALLASGVAALLGLPMRRLLDRSRRVEDQSALGAEARRVNLRGAFEARSGPAGVIVVDDLITTGATASACARALRASGARTVEFLVACRRS